MKHSNLHLETLRHTERTEFINALRAHGGEYTFATFDDRDTPEFEPGDLPFALLWFDAYYSRSCGMYVYKATLRTDSDGQAHIHLEGYDEDFEPGLTAETSGIAIGSLHNLMDHMNDPQPDTPQQ